jgi:hypothetical protein
VGMRLGGRSLVDCRAVGTGMGRKWAIADRRAGGVGSGLVNRSAVGTEVGRFWSGRVVCRRNYGGMGDRSVIRTGVGWQVVESSEP